MSSQKEPLALYFWPTPNGKKVTILLEELAVPYILHRVKLGEGAQFTPEFTKISPNNRIPALVDPGGPGGAPLSVFESGAILQYLGNKFGAFYPSEPRARVAVEEWLMWQMSGFGPILGQSYHFRFSAPEKIPYAITRFLEESKRLYGVLDRQLAEYDFVAGAYSIADMALVPWAIGWKRQEIDVPGMFPNVQRWLDRLSARPAVVRGLAAGQTEAAS